VQVTLVAWYAAVAVTVAVSVAARGVTVTAVRLATIPSATIGALAAGPVARASSGRVLADEVVPAVVGGAVLGALTALAIVFLTAVGVGITVHAALLWCAALVLNQLVDTVTYAGIVEPFGVAALETSPLRGLGYHPARILPAAVATVLLTAGLAVRARRRGARRGTAITGAAAGPVLAAATYWVTPDARFLWNEDAARFMLWIAVACVLVALPSALVRGRAPTS
jgi:hypothetical protein